MITLISSAESIPQKGPVLMIFSASWCGPCRAMAPHLELVAQRLEGRISFVKVDLDTAQDLAAEYHIQSIPTLIYLDNGRPKDRRIGQLQEGQISEWLDALLADTTPKAPIV